MIDQITKERGIIFTGDMIQAILQGHKTMTRRIIKFKQWPEVPVKNMTEHFEPYTDSPKNFQCWSADHDDGGKRWYVEQEMKCPYGFIHDRLWVRESWRELIDYGEGTNSSSNQVVYKADEIHRALPDLNANVKWKSGRFMPRSASRILLEVVNVRTERLQDITPEDCEAEGMRRFLRKAYGDEEAYFRVPAKDVALHHIETDSILEAFMQLWQGINAARGQGWDVNPWVWVITFKTIDQTKGVANVKETK